MAKTRKMPPGARSLTPYICVSDAKAAMAFYKKAFGAKELFRLTEPGGKVGHAEMTIGDSPLMISDEYPDWGALSPKSIGGSPVILHLYVKDADAVIRAAVRRGATLLRPASDEFYGDRSGMVSDPFGYKWMIATPKVKVSPKEMQKRFRAMFKGA